MVKLYDVIIIGTGCTGYAAGMYAGRFGMKTLVIGDDPGGLITWTDTVENYPGFKKLTGTELANKLKEHAEEYPIEIIADYVEKISKKKTFTVTTRSKKKFEGKTVILATGTKVRELDAPGAQEFKNKGVHHCALCDGYAFKDKVVALVGGSDSAVKDALVLSELAKKVFIIYRGEQIHPEPINLMRIKKRKNIEIINNTNVTHIKGDKTVTHILLDKPYKGKKQLDVSGVFVAIGHISLSQLAKDLGVKLNQKGEVLINRHGETNIEGFYAAGDVTDTEFKQAITGVAEAVTACYYAFGYIGEKF